MRGLTGQVAIVTGASRGIGRAVALELASWGARVAVNYQRSAAAAAAVVAEIEQAGGEALAVQADVTQPAEVAAMVRAALERWGALHILVNNAGVTRDNLFQRMKDADWDTVIDTDLTSAFLCAQAVLPAMRAAGYGRIVNVASLAGLAGNVGQANYAAAKMGLVGLTKALARELTGAGIVVNAVAPGFVETEMIESIPQWLREWALDVIPLKRFGEAEEIAPAVAFLASPAASYIIGHTLTIDGGWVMP
ncbi:MAG TPA: 3-oxoacyl-ACP reductase family protein [Herpetosiphonaceae bacterium]